MKTLFKKPYLVGLLLLVMTSSTVIAVEKSLMQLKSCPDSPNCVSSQNADQSHRISPIGFQGDPQQALATIKKVILALPRTQLLEEKEAFLHVVFTSRFFSFLDDLEVLVDATEHVIHIRSASRTGYSDFGVNRSRVEKIRAGFERLSKAK